MVLILLVTLLSGIFLGGIERKPSVPNLTQHPSVWSDGSGATHEVVLILNVLELVVLRDSLKKHGFVGSVERLDLLPHEVADVAEKCRFFRSVRGPFQSVQRAEIWGVILLFSRCRPLLLCMLGLTIWVLFGTRFVLWRGCLLPSHLQY